MGGEMTDNLPGPGWWLASDGKWYPPEAHPSVRQPVSNLPQLPPLVGFEPKAALDGGSPPPRSVYDSSFAAPAGEPSKSGPPHLKLVLILVLVLVIAGTVGGIALSSHSTTSTNASPTTVAKPLAPPSDPGTEAANIGLQASDLGGKFTAASTNDIAATRSTASPCTPLSGGPWVADEESPLYTASSGALNVASDVVIMSTAADADGALTAINAPSYGTTCFQPANDGLVQNSLEDQGSSCDLSFENSSIGELGPSSLSGDLTGYSYTANVLCSRTGQSTPIIINIVDEVVGAVFLQARFMAFGDPAPAILEETVMRQMAARAKFPNK
jgi:hypothetical protein